MASPKSVRPVPPAPPVPVVEPQTLDRFCGEGSSGLSRWVRVGQGYPGLLSRLGEARGSPILIQLHPAQRVGGALQQRQWGRVGNWCLKWPKAGVAPPCEPLAWNRKTCRAAASQLEPAGAPPGAHWRALEVAARRLKRKPAVSPARTTSTALSGQRERNALIDPQQQHVGLTRALVPGGDDPTRWTWSRRSCPSHCGRSMRTAHAANPAKQREFHLGLGCIVQRPAQCNNSLETLETSSKPPTSPHQCLPCPSACSTLHRHGTAQNSQQLRQYILCTP